MGNESAQQNGGAATATSAAITAGFAAASAAGVMQTSPQRDGISGYMQGPVIPPLPPPPPDTGILAHITKVKRQSYQGHHVKGGAGAVLFILC